MKLKSLFLATLAAMAMASCSNDNDPINNGNQAEKDALLQFRISFGNSVNTRVEGTDAQEDTEAGLNNEQKFTEALLIVAYENGANEVVKETITRDKFLPVTTTEDPASNGNYYQSVPFNVRSGKVKAYVVLNPGTLSTASITGAMTPETVETKLKELTLSGSPSTESFVMYGANNAAFTDLAVGQTTAVSVTVDRVAAKLKEETPKANLTATVSKDFEGKALAGEQTVTVKLTSYDFTNLPTGSNLVYQTGNTISTFTNTFDGSTVPELTYNKTLGTEANYYGDENADKKGNVIPTAQIDYCWENEKAETETDKGDNITSIIYKGLIEITGDGHTSGENVYVFNNKAYNYKELKAVLPSLDLAEDATIDEYEKRGIYRYENGVCYYRKPITTSGNPVIKRNNVYKLKVSSILSIGYPTPIPPVKQTMMQLYITVNEWTVNVNSFTLGQ